MGGGIGVGEVDEGRGKEKGGEKKREGGRLCLILLKLLLLGGYEKGKFGETKEKGVRDSENYKE